MDFTEFLDEIEKGPVNQRFDEMMASAETEAQRFTAEQKKWQYNVEQYEKAELEKQRNELGYGSW